MADGIAELSGSSRLSKSLADRRAHRFVNPTERGLQAVALENTANFRLHLGRLAESRQKPVRRYLRKSFPVHRSGGSQDRATCIKTQNRVPHPCFFQNTPPPVCFVQPTMMP